MGNNSNRVIAIFAVALVSIMVVLLATSLGPGGGGGGAPATATAPVETSESATSTISSNTTTGSDPSVSEWATGDYETDLARLRQELETASPVGANARDASTSVQVTTAQETYSDLQSRGFDDAVLQANFDLQGELRENTEVDNASTEKSPSYAGSYFSEQGVLWTLYVNDGQIFAVPVASTGTQITQHIILTETDHIVQYDGVSNQYSDWPVGVLSDGSKVVQVPRIDKAALDAYSVADIEAQ